MFVNSSTSLFFNLTLTIGYIRHVEYYNFLFTLATEYHRDLPQHHL